MNNLAKRTVVGLPGAAIVVWLIFFNAYTFLFLFLMITLMSLREFYFLNTNETVKPQMWMGILSGCLVFIAVVSIKFDLFPASFPTEKFEVLIIIPLLFSIFIFELFRRMQQPFLNVAFTFLGILYIPFTMGLASLIAWCSWDGAFRPSNLFGYFFILWANDIGAYFGGKWFGKTKLFERISPKKTWEGVAGGIVLAAVVAHFISLYCPGLSRKDWLFVTGIIIGVSTLGDLVESMFKRSIQIKDSGTILPGHGGFLDRFDGFFISAPFVFAYLYFVNGW